MATFWSGPASATGALLAVAAVTVTLLGALLTLPVVDDQLNDVVSIEIGGEGRRTAVASERTAVLPTGTLARLQVYVRGSLSASLLALPSRVTRLSVDV